MDEQTTPQASAEPEVKTPELELLDFWAVWCGPCKVMAPILDEVEQEFKDKMVIKKLNVDEDATQMLIGEYKILSVPTYILRHNGQVLDTMIGAQPKSVVVDKINKALQTISTPAAAE